MEFRDRIQLYTSLSHLVRPHFLRIRGKNPKLLFELRNFLWGKKFDFTLVETAGDKVVATGVILFHDFSSPKPNKITLTPANRELIEKIAQEIKERFEIDCQVA
ncbi:MAG: hypothetical protein UW68_C0053G0008 [Candidatus Collierbacteria bacterium GW2011_GWB1_44_6]|uniref:Uncharacterized protein n=1 Tax=Candidatus Collierbacteria bacterium GW2011_GWB1_44_6 TaxID=1618384 RepID=A0A0G1MIS0_9BACT|nr:MAG: hypothetical protein UW68_C0053G0008 [Candidatus Collierbacteria bacterium GW2011_GWB1_44_6]KKT82465.1 MAG: hypothetical protein UW80_C0036G0007 [Microgenomates group bacterium GW2011_GWC1_44_9]